jgi:hypothetical protein
MFWIWNGLDSLSFWIWSWIRLQTRGTSSILKLFFRSVREINEEIQVSGKAVSAKTVLNSNPTSPKSFGSGGIRIQNTAKRIPDTSPEIWLPDNGV